MNEVIVPSKVQFNEQDRIKEGGFRFADKYAGRKISQFTTPRGGRHYEVEGYKFDFTSVTSITGIVNKRGIPDWYKRKGIEKAIEIMDEPGAQARLEMQAKGKNDRARKHKNNTWQTQLYDEAKVGPKEAMDFAAKFGNDSHELIEAIALQDIGRPRLDTSTPDSQYIPIIEGFKAWLRHADMHIVASEMTVYHPAYKYAGTIDLVCALNKDPYSLVVVDLKTGGVFDEAAMQLSAYTEALRYLLPPYSGLVNPCYSYHVDEAWVLQLPRERPIEWDADKLYEIYKVNDIQGYFDAFDNAHKLRGLLEKEAWSS
tara:strand:+ start:1047 stop:1988 length:942 start_codon:yes stop_codon:yes gene_type:complete